MKKVLTFMALGTIAISSLSAITYADELSDLLNSTPTSTGSTGGTSSTTSTTNTGSSTTPPPTPTPTLGGTGTQIPPVTTPLKNSVPTAPVNITVTNGTWKQTIADTNTIIFFKATKDTAIENIFSVAYVNDLQMVTTVKGSDLRNFFDISTVRADGSELTLASNELKTVKAGDELKISLTANSQLLNRELTFVVPQGLNPDRYGTLNTAGGSASISILGRYIIVGETGVTNSGTNGHGGRIIEGSGAVMASSGATVSNDVVPNTKTGAKENILMIILAIIAIGILAYKQAIRNT